MATELGRPKNKSDGYRRVIMAIFIAQYVNSAIMVILVYSSFFYPKHDIALHDTSRMLVGPYDEFGVQWYLVVGAPLTVTVLLQIFSP